MADELLTDLSAEALVSFLSGNLSPAWEIAVCCSAKNISQLFKVGLMIARNEDEEVAADTTLAIVRGLNYRYNGNIPEELALALVKSIRNLPPTEPEKE